MARCRNIWCNDEKDGYCIGIPCGGADTPPPVQSDKSPDTDPRFRCTVCGQIGTVGRCCGLETREPLNEAARMEIDRDIEDRHEKSESRAGIPSFQVNAGR
jgi:hypothetical protein